MSFANIYTDPNQMYCSRKNPLCTHCLSMAEVVVKDREDGEILLSYWQ